MSQSHTCQSVSCSSTTVKWPAISASLDIFHLKLKATLNVAAWLISDISSTLHELCYGYQSICLQPYPPNYVGPKAYFAYKTLYTKKKSTGRQVFKVHVWEHRFIQPHVRIESVMPMTLWTSCPSALMLLSACHSLFICPNAEKSVHTRHTYLSWSSIASICTYTGHQQPRPTAYFEAKLSKPIYNS